MTMIPTPVMYVDEHGVFISRVSAEQVEAVLGPIIDEIRGEQPQMTADDHAELMMYRKLGTHHVKDLRMSKWLDPECAAHGACQSLKFKPAEERTMMTAATFNALVEQLEAREESQRAKEFLLGDIPHGSHSYTPCNQIVNGVRCTYHRIGDHRVCDKCESRKQSM